MTADVNVTPTSDIASPRAKDNPGFSAFTVDRLGMEVASELGVDPGDPGAYGLTAEKIDQYEGALHSRRSRNSNSR